MSRQHLHNKISSSLEYKKFVQMSIHIYIVKLCCDLIREYFKVNYSFILREYQKEYVQSIVKRLFMAKGF